MINILIRTSNRPKAFKRCIESVYRQEYRDRVQMIICADDGPTAKYAAEIVNEVSQTHESCVDSMIMQVAKGHMKYYYNTYLNEMMHHVKQGWAWIIDDDDTLADGAIKRLETELAQPCLKTDNINMFVFQMQRADIIKPYGMTKEFKPVLGQIGMPCFLLHHSLKNVSTFKSKVDADFQYIRDVMEVANYRVINEVFVNVSPRGHGKPESKISQ